MIYDLAILGGGPAGIAAGVYAARKRLHTLFITDSWGGQSIVSGGIENWIGTPMITGNDLAESLKTHLTSYKGEGFEIREGERATSLSQNEDKTFTVSTNKGNYQAKAVLIATGSTRRKLEIPGAVEFENKGITYCASCDGPLFSGKDLAVIGGRNAAFETAAQLLAYAKSVTLLNRGPEFRADAITVEKVLANPKMKAIINASLVEIKGDAFVKSLVYEDAVTKEKIEIATEGIFVEIGLLPTTDFAKPLIPLNQFNQIPIDPRTQATSVSGIWAAGDCTDVLYHQNNIAAGDGVRALEDIYMHLHTK